MEEGASTTGKDAASMPLYAPSRAIPLNRVSRKESLIAILWQGSCMISPIERRAGGAPDANTLYLGGTP